MRLALPAVLFLVACGGKPAAKPTISNKPTGPTAPSCADAGALLRGGVDADDPEKSGPAREAAIANACEMDHWAPGVIACVAGTPTPQACLDKLTDKQQESYQAKLEAWSAQYGGAQYGGDMYGGGGGGALDKYTDCEDAIGDAAAFVPSVDEKAPEHDWIVKVRHSKILNACEEQGWSEEAKECLQGAKDGATITACLAAQLDDSQRAEVAKRIGEVDGLGAKIATARKKPASIGCKQVVAAHYADAKWKDKLDGVKPADKKKAIAASRDKMTKACTADKWDDSLRACLVAGGADACFDAATVGHVWTYPALGTAPPIGVAECDEYGAEIAKIAACPKLPQASRDALVQSFEQVRVQWLQMPPKEREELKAGCKAAVDAIKQAAASMCPP